MKKLFALLFLLAFVGSASAAVCNSTFLNENTILMNYSGISKTKAGAWVNVSALIQASNFSQSDYSDIAFYNRSNCAVIPAIRGEKGMFRIKPPGDWGNYPIAVASNNN